MPVRNEGPNLNITLKIVKALVTIPHEVLVVYDTLDDNSIPVVNELKKDYPSLKGVHNKLGVGVSNAIKSGVMASNAEYVFVLPADDIGPIIAISDMVDLMDSGCDMVSATRYAYGGRVMGGNFISRLMSRISNSLFSLFSRSALTDSTVGIKMFKRSLLDEIRLEARPIGWAVAFELAMKAQIAGKKLGEVPIISINRFFSGKSSFKLRSWTAEYTRWFIWGLWNLFRAGKLNVRARVKVPDKIRARRR